MCWGELPGAILVVVVGIGGWLGGDFVSPGWAEANGMAFNEAKR